MHVSFLKDARDGKPGDVEASDTCLEVACPPQPAPGNADTPVDLHPAASPERLDDQVALVRDDQGLGKAVDARPEQDAVTRLSRFHGRLQPRGVPDPDVPGLGRQQGKCGEQQEESAAAVHGLSFPSRRNHAARARPAAVCGSPVS